MYYPRQDSAPAGSKEQIDADLDKALGQVDSWVDGAIRLLPNICVALVILLVFYLLGQLSRHLILRHLSRRDRVNLGEVLGGLVKWGIVLVGFLLAATIVMPSLKPGDLVAGLGVSSVAIGFAFKDILQNWLAGLLILLRQPFEVGDQIRVGEFEGTVQRIETRATLIDTFDLQRVVIPNSDIYTNAVVVGTAHPMRRSDYEVGIGYEENIDQACEIIRDTLLSVDGVLKTPAPEALPWDLAASWVTIRVRWWTHSQRGDVTHVRAKVVQAIKESLEAADIDMPYETQLHLLRESTSEVNPATAAKTKLAKANKDNNDSQES